MINKTPTSIDDVSTGQVPQDRGKKVTVTLREEKQLLARAGTGERLLPDFPINVEILGRVFGGRASLWVRLIRCVEAAKAGNAEAKVLVAHLSDLGERFLVHRESDEGRPDSGPRPWPEWLRVDWREFEDGILDWDARNFPEVARRLKPAPQYRPLTDLLLYASDNMNGATIRAFSSPQGWLPNPMEGLAYGIEHRFENMNVTIGLANGDQATSLWEFLCKGGPKMVKSHYALWARWYEEKGRLGEPITINISQFCTDIGYTKHHKGGFRRETKQEAIKILEALTSVEVRAIFTAPTKNITRLRGPLWSRGMIAEETKYADLFGQSRAGDPALWEPLAFSYTPGPWFQNAEWRNYNKAVGKISVGLMQLDVRIDNWPILIGGYLGTLIRTNQYRPRRLYVRTILDRTGLAQNTDSRRRAAETQAYFERAFTRLQEVGVIKSWQWVNVDEADLEDPNDPGEIEEYYAKDPLPPNDWRHRRVDITFNMDADAARLEARQAVHTKAIKKKSVQPKI